MADDEPSLVAGVSRMLPTAHVPPRIVRLTPTRPPGRTPAAVILLSALAPVLALGIHGIDGATESTKTTKPARPEIPRTGYVERETSELVLIETYVTDRMGRPVRGLTRDDFILEVGGLLRPILSADFHEVGSQGAPAAGGVGTNGSTTRAAGRSWPRRIVLFFEDNTSVASGLTLAREAAARFLETGLTPSDEVALVSYDQRLHYIQGFTADRDLLRKALAANRVDAARVSNFWGEVREQMYELMNNPDPRLVQTLCEEQKFRFAGSLKGVRTVASSLAGWRGYKAIVYMGNGIPESPMEPVWKAFQRFNERHPGHAFPMFQMRCMLSDEIKDLARAASAAGVTIHTVQTWGLTAAPARGQEMVGKWSSALDTLALNTAGIATESNDMLAAMRQIEEASRAYYVLAYEPQEQADGRYRHVIVRCKKKGTQVRFRRGFTRLPPAEARQQAIEAAYLFPEMSTDLGLDLTVADGPRGGKERIVDLVLHLPLDQMLFLPDDRGAVARLSIGFVGLDNSERKTLDTSRSVIIRRPVDARDLTGIDFYCRTRLPVASQTVTAVITDEQTGALGGARAVLAEEVAANKAAVGLSLYSLAESSLWIEVPPERAEAHEEGDVADYSIGPALKGIFTAGEPILAAFKVAPGQGNPAPEMRIEIRSGDVIVRSRPVGDTFETYPESIKVPLPVDGLAAGEYRLSIRAAFTGGGVTLAAGRFRIVEADLPSRP
jgi:VWFA-related protein